MANRAHPGSGGSTDPRPTNDWQGSVVIPAHNEESVIGRCLDALSRDDSSARLQVVVAANGCTDATAVLARQRSAALPGLQVIELDEPGKIGALNAADAVATAFPRVYLDADILLSPGSLTDLISTLSTAEPLVAAPQVRFDTTSASWPVRSFYRAFEDLPYARDGLVGLGIYGLSRSARDRFGVFPDVVADDLFVQRMFAPYETRTTAGTFVVQTPRRLRDLVGVRTRVARGNRELHASPPLSPDKAGSLPPGTDGPSTASTARSLQQLAFAGPSGFTHALVYSAVTLAARGRARTDRSTGWIRDESSRGPAEPGNPVEPDAALRVAYLVSQYPAPSHVFIEREIEALRARGVGVETFSIRPTPNDELLSRQMRAEAKTTTVVLARKSRLLWAGLSTLARHPQALGGAVRLALGSGERTVRSRLYQLVYLVEATLVLRAMRRKKLAHLHVHFANNGADVARLVVELGTAIDGADRGWRWSLTLHGPTEFEAVAKVDLPAKLLSAAAVACISDFTRSQAMRLLPPSDWAKLTVAPMSVDTRRFSPGAPAATTRPLRVLSVGRLVPEKAAPVLVEALLQTLAAGVELEARIVGAGPMKEMLEERINAAGSTHSITLLGAVGQEQLPDLYRWADVFCLPSFQEGLPVVLMEAMASGLPVVTTYVAGIPELVEDGANGLLVPAGRADLIAAALCDLATSPGTRAEMGAAGRRVVCSRHSLDVAGRQMHTFLRGVTQR